MTSFVLVHGGNMSTETWNRHTTAAPVHTPDELMGGRIWHPLIPGIKGVGGTAFAPTLLPERNHNLSDHIGQISDLIHTNDLDDVVLAGHSYGGMVITGVAARHPDRVRGMLYVDAALPDPGQSLFDLLVAAGSDPLTVEGLVSDPPYLEALDYDPATLAPLPKTYLLCTNSEFTAVTRMAQQRITAGTVGKNWTYTELPTWHVPMADMPERVSALLTALGTTRS